MRFHFHDQACSDNVGFIKGLDKHNMHRRGDAMVPPSQITMGFLGHVAADAFKQSARAAAAAPSSNVELLRFQQIGVGPALGPGY